MHCDKPMRAHAAGFTLIELLVAITILAIIAVLGWRGLDSIIRSRAALTAEMEQTRGIQIAFAQIENDCAHLADNSILPGREVMQAAVSRLLIIRTVFEENQPTRLQVVSYRVVNGVFSRRQSVATRELAVLDEDWQRALNDAEEVPAITLQTGVSNIAMRTWTNGESGWRIAGSEASTGSSAASAVSALGNKKRTGLEIALQLQGNALPMIKAFLLGAV